LYNLLDLPSGVVPVGVVRKEEETYDDPYHNDKATRKSKESVKGAEGLPLAVQVITLPFQEELCLNIMKQIEKGVNFKAKPNI
jgi:fatty acid amide hydrolase